MSIGDVVQLFNASIFQVLTISAPILLVSIVVGLIVSVLQATTSIQDQTLSFVPKIAAILAVLVIFGPWMFTLLRNFTVQLFQRIPDMVR